MSSASSLSSSSVIPEVEGIAGGGGTAILAAESADCETRSTKRDQGVTKTQLDSHTRESPSPEGSIQTPTHNPRFPSYYFRIVHVPYPPAKRSYIMRMNVGDIQ